MLRVNPTMAGNSDEKRQKKEELHVVQNIQKLRQNTQSHAFRNWQQLGPYNFNSTVESLRN